MNHAPQRKTTLFIVDFAGDDTISNLKHFISIGSSPSKNRADVLSLRIKVVMLSSHKLLISLMIDVRVHCNEVIVNTSEMDRTGKWVSRL